MNIKIGTVIKNLRTKRRNTQDQLAAALGVTAQAVSRWENGTGYPDIEYLPALADYFGVTSDELLGINKDERKQRISDLYDAIREVGASGDHKRSIGMWLDGIMEFPDSFKLISQYVDEVYMYGWMLEDREDHEKRAFMYIDRILSDCADNDIRNETIATAGMWHARLGNTDKALEFADKLHGYFTKQDMLLRIYSGTKKYEHWRELIGGRFVNTVGDICAFAKSKDDDGNDIFTDEEKLELYKKAAAFLELFYEDGDYMFEAQYLKTAYSHIAWAYGKLADADSCLDALEKAAEMSIEFDTYDHEAAQTSLLARGNVPGGIWWHDSHNVCYEQLEWMEESKSEEFEFIKNDSRFIEIVNRLKEYAK